MIQEIFTVFQKVKWRDCEENDDYEWYYAELMHYVVHNKRTNAYWFVKSKNPSNAYDIVKKKLSKETIDVSD